MNLRIAAIGSFLTCMLGTAQAITLTLPYPVTGDLMEEDATLSLQKFNPALGTLNSVTVEASAQFEGSGDLKNTNQSQSATFDVKLDGQLSLAMPSPLGTIDSRVTLVDEKSMTLRTLQAKSWAYSFEGKSTQLFQQANDPLKVAAFVGSDKIEARLFADALTSIDGPSTRSGGFETSAFGKVVVTYDYTAAAVPEPETWALLLAGIGAIGTITSRRNRPA